MSHKQYNKNTFKKTVILLKYKTDHHSTEGVLVVASLQHREVGEVKCYTHHNLSWDAKPEIPIDNIYWNKFWKYIVIIV